MEKFLAFESDADLLPRNFPDRIHSLSLYCYMLVLWSVEKAMLLNG